jgi:hypothetical protein
MERLTEATRLQVGSAAADVCACQLLLVLHVFMMCVGFSDVGQNVFMPAAGKRPAAACCC